MLAAIEGYSKAPKVTVDHAFALGEAIHTLQDLYTPSHVVRNAQGQITQFQGYAEQGPGLHSKADMPKAGSPAYKKQVKLSTEFLCLAADARAQNWGRAIIRKKLNPHLALAKGASAGGSHKDYIPTTTLGDLFWTAVNPVNHVPDWLAFWR